MIRNMIVISRAKLQNKCLKVCEWVEVVEWNRRYPLPPPSPMIPCQSSVSVKENPDRKNKKKIHKANKAIGIICKFNNILPRSALLTIYHSLIRSHLDYGDVIYDQPENESFSGKIESVQYNASLAIIGAITGTSQETL